MNDEINVYERIKENNMITDRYGNKLKKSKNKPTVMQAVNSWDIVNELTELGYCNNFQHERDDIVDYIYKVSSIIDKAMMISEKR